MVTLSRKRRCTRVLTVRRNQVAAVDAAKPIAAPLTKPGRCSKIPLPNSISHNAISASGSAASCDRASAATIRRGSCRYPSLHNRHMEESAGGSGVMESEGVIRCAFLFGQIEALRLQIEHGAVTPGEFHQFVVRAEFDHTAMLKHADSIGMADR